MSKVIIITGGTGGIGYQEALWLAGLPEKHTIVITGRRQESAEKAVKALKEATGNEKIEYALGDLKVQSNVKALAKELTSRFPKIDELINNAGNLTVTELCKTSDGIDENFAVNVIAPLLLTRGLVPSLKAATPAGKVQITSGGSPFDTIDMDDLEGVQKKAGLEAYSHSKRVMEAMAVALSRELAGDGIAVNVVGGALPGATSMTQSRDDAGASAKKCASPCVKAALATSKELGTGKAYLEYPKQGKFKPAVADTENQDVVMKFVSTKLL